MPAYDFRDVMYALEDVGFFEIVLPFLLVFTIVFAILEKTNLLGKDKDGEPKTNLNGVLALIFSFLIFDQIEIVYMINQFIPKIALLAVVFIMFMFLFGIFLGSEEQQWQEGFLLIPGIFIIIMVLWAFFSPEFTGDWSDFTYWWDVNYGFIIPLLLFFGILVLVFKRKKPSAARSLIEYFTKRK